MSKRVEFDKLKLSNNSDPEREKTDTAADRKYSSHVSYVVCNKSRNDLLLFFLLSINS